MSLQRQLREVLTEGAVVEYTIEELVIDAVSQVLGLMVRVLRVTKMETESPNHY